MLRIKLRDPRTKIKPKTLTSLKENMRHDVISAILAILILKICIENNLEFYVIRKLVDIIKTFCEFDDEYVQYLDDIFTVTKIDNSNTNKLTSVLDLSFNDINSCDVFIDDVFADETIENKIDYSNFENSNDFYDNEVKIDFHDESNKLNIENTQPPKVSTNSLMVVKKTYSPSNETSRADLNKNSKSVVTKSKTLKNNSPIIDKLSVKINESFFVTEGAKLEILPTIGGLKQNEQLIYMWEINKKNRWNTLVQQPFPQLIIDSVKSSMNMNKFRLVVIYNGEKVFSNICTIAVNKAQIKIKLDENRVMKKDEGIVIIPQIKFNNVDMSQVKFQWYSSADNGYTWDEIPNQISDELFLDKVNPVDNNQYQLCASYLNKTYKSNVVNVKLSHAIIFIPSEMNVREQNDLIIDPQITLYNIEPRTVKYQWMYKLNNGNWDKISSSITTSNNKKLKIKNIPFTDSGISFKLVLFTLDGSVFESNECSLTTKQLTPNIKLHINEQKISINQHSTLMVDCTVKSQNVVHNKINYSWQVNNGDGFKNIAYQNSSTLIIDNIDLSYNSTELRLQACVTASNGEMYFFYSNTISLEIIETTMIDIPVSVQPKITISELTAQDTDTTMKKYFFHDSNEFTKNRSNFTYKIFYYDGSSNGENITRSFVNVKPSDSYQGDLLVRVELYAKPGFIFNNKWTTLVSDTMVLYKN